MAAKILKEKNIEFIVLESTDHVGGRARTLKSSPPVEFGPEFLHGETPLTDELMESYNLPWYDMKFDYHIFKDGKLKPIPDFWKRICDVSKGINLKVDMPFIDYLSTVDAHSQEDKDLVASFVQGFEAADLSMISTKDLPDMCDPNLGKMRRPLNGYGELMERLSNEVISHVYFNYSVEEISWEKNKAIVKGTIGKENLPFEFEAEKIIETVSIGVLKTQQINPRPKALEEFIDKTEMGQVVKVIADLDHEFFHSFPKNTFPFISSPDLSFTAWWTTTPIHTTLVTAWAGGEKARELAKLSEDELRERFIKELSTISKLPVDQIQSWCRVTYHYDWNHDSSYLGAYSYPKVNRDDDKLETVFEDTLYFAGEAFDEEMSGTIEGAFQTGKSAAEKVIGLPNH